jgi:hypothetical protein
MTGDENGGDGGVRVPEALREYLRDGGTSEYLAVAHYDQDEFIFELSEELRAKYTDAELGAVVEDLRLRDVGRDRESGLRTAGDLHCSVRAFDNTVLLHFVCGPGRGTVVSLPPESSAGVTALVDDVLEVLDEHSEQEVESVPSWSETGP